MIYVLIVFMMAGNSSGGGAAQSVQLASKEACEFAGASLKRQATQFYTHYVCAPATHAQAREEKG